MKIPYLYHCFDSSPLQIFPPAPSRRETRAWLSLPTLLPAMQCPPHQPPLLAVLRHLILPTKLQRLPHGCPGHWHAAPRVPSLRSSLHWGPLPLVPRGVKYVFVSARAEYRFPIYGRNGLDVVVLFQWSSASLSDSHVPYSRTHWKEGRNAFSFEKHPAIDQQLLE